jgi:hypothetical protein
MGFGMGFFWGAMHMFHVPVQLGMSLKSFSAYFAGFLARLQSFYGFFMYWWSFGKIGTYFDLNTL